MIVSIVHPGPLGMILGALLHLQGVPVGFQPRSSAPKGGRIRVNLPDGRFLIEGIGSRSPISPSPFLVVVGGGAAADREARRRPADQAADGRQGTVGVVVNRVQELSRTGDRESGRWEEGLVLAEPMMLDGSCVELPEPGASVVAPRGSRFAEIAEPLAGFGFSIHLTDDIHACANSFRLGRLLDLPVAMCNTTRAHFLSCPQGREIACRILEEGCKAYRKTGEPLGRLPSGDPLDLLKRLSRSPRSFDGARFLPGRAYNPTLQGLMRGDAEAAKGANLRIVELAAGAGLRLEWNWKITQKLSRVHGAGFFAGPAELLAAIG
jgi:hypothetical protein